ncbi:transposable element Tc1 transposase [Trichonephila clavipes]|nr:transposable element Tc1 transposase [Trichonephila clavipes]
MKSRLPTIRRWIYSIPTMGRIIGKLEKGRNVTSGAAEFGIAHSIVSQLWRQFQTTGTTIRGFSSGRPRGTTPADDRYIVLQARRNRRQTAGEIARHTTQATGRPISRFTVARRLHGGGLFARRPVRCVPLTPTHRGRHESRFSLSTDSHRILIWRERGSRNHPWNIIERDRYGGRGVLVWGGIMIGSRTDLHIFDAGSVNGTRYCNEILLPYVRLFRGAMGLQFLFMDDNAPCHRTVAAEQLLESEDIERMDWPARSPDLNPIEHVWEFLSRRLAARTLPPVTIRELRLALISHRRVTFTFTAQTESKQGSKLDWVSVTARCFPDEVVRCPLGGKDQLAGGYHPQSALSTNFYLARERLHLQMVAFLIYSLKSKVAFFFIL